MAPAPNVRLATQRVDRPDRILHALTGTRWCVGDSIPQDSAIACHDRVIATFFYLSVFILSRGVVRPCILIVSFIVSYFLVRLGWPRSSWNLIGNVSRPWAFAGLIHNFF